MADPHLFLDDDPVLWISEYNEIAKQQCCIFAFAISCRLRNLCFFRLSPQEGLTHVPDRRSFRIRHPFLPLFQSPWIAKRIKALPCRRRHLLL